MVLLNKTEIENLIENMSVDELIGQMLCFNFAPNYTNEKIEEIVRKTHAGSFFFGSGAEVDKIKMCTEVMNEHSKIPGMIAADIEAGPGHVLKDGTKLPASMAWGACDDTELIKKAHEATAEVCREAGIHWTFSPIVDINYNKDNPVTNIRAISDDPEIVSKNACAAINGFQKNGLIMAGCKHFPGDGIDDRNQHFCTTVNALSKEEWMRTFGYVYKNMIANNVASVMVAHISLPAYDEKLNDWLGYSPASLSYNLQTKLLKEELGFDGCIVSDALSMVGVCAVADYDRISIEFVKAGGDMLLFPTVDYFYEIKDAVLIGEIPMERIKDAVRRILNLKNRARLFENKENVLKDIKHELNIDELAQEIADKSITLIRNYDDILPLNLKKGDKILILNIKKDKEPETATYSCDLTEVEEDLIRRGFIVKSYINASRAEIKEDLMDFAAVLVNCKISSQDYLGGTLRITWQHIAPFWRGEILKHPRMIFTSFGDPYKIHDFPYLKTYINAYSFSESTQRAFVKALLGEIQFNGKSPVSFDGYFARG